MLPLSPCHSPAPRVPPEASENPRGRQALGRATLRRRPGRRLPQAACVAVLVTAGAACGSEDSSEASEGSANANANAITLKLIAFTPNRVETPVGGTVTWRQEDVATHTVTSGRVDQAGGTVTATADGKFDSGNIAEGQSFQFMFSEPGEFAFYCAIHPATMTGVVTVK